VEKGKRAPSEVAQTPSEVVQERNVEAVLGAEELGETDASEVARRHDQEWLLL
jgi:hypothetical protein